MNENKIKEHRTKELGILREAGRLTVFVSEIRSLDFLDAS